MEFIIFQEFLDKYMLKWNIDSNWIPIDFSDFITSDSRDYLLVPVLADRYRDSRKIENIRVLTDTEAEKLRIIFWIHECLSVLAKNAREIYDVRHRYYFDRGDEVKHGV